jgi:uncharacterized protein YbjT (DUF2867 family)
MVVERLQAAGHEPVVLARSRGVNVLTGDGLEEALARTSAIIDVTNVTTNSRRKAVAFFGTGTGNLLRAAERAGVGHHVVLSIVGCDRVEFGYYEGKRRQEQLTLEGPVPATVLRATQFHEFPAQLLARVPGPLALAPRMRSQTVAAAEVAEHLVRLATGPAVGLAPDLAGPEVHEMTDLVRQVLRAQHSRRLAVPLRIPGAGGKAMAAGALLPTEDGPRGRVTFAEWLAATYG